MAFYRIPIGSGMVQKATVRVNNVNYLIDLHYNGRASMWFVSVQETATQRWLCINMPLVLGLPLLLQSAEAIFIFPVDNSGAGLDPVLAGDFAGRVDLYIADNDNESIQAFFPTYSG